MSLRKLTEFGKQDEMLNVIQVSFCPVIVLSTTYKKEELANQTSVKLHEMYDNGPNIFDDWDKHIKAHMFENGKNVYEQVDWKLVKNTFVDRSVLPEVMEHGKCNCIIGAYPSIKGMEGIESGNVYSYEFVDNGFSENIKRDYYRIFHNIEESFYYETCSVPEFKDHFEVIEEE